MSQITDTSSIENRGRPESIPAMLASMLNYMAVDESDPGQSVVGTIKAECECSAAWPTYYKETNWDDLAENAGEFPGSVRTKAAQQAALAMSALHSGNKSLSARLTADSIMTSVQAIPETRRNAIVQNMFGVCILLCLKRTQPCVPGSMPSILAYMIHNMDVDSCDPSSSVAKEVKAECERCAVSPSHLQEVDWKRLTNAARNIPDSVCATAVQYTANAMWILAFGNIDVFVKVAARSIMLAASVVPETNRDAIVRYAFEALLLLYLHTTDNSGQSLQVGIVPAV